MKRTSSPSALSVVAAASPNVALRAPSSNPVGRLGKLTRDLKANTLIGACHQGEAIFRGLHGRFLL
jgi:hypothetical protein